MRPHNAVNSDAKNPNPRDNNTKFSTTRGTFLKRGIAIGALLALSLSLSSCGKAGAKPDSTAADSTAADSTAADSESLLIWADGSRIEGVTALGKAFTEKTDIGVNVVEKSESDLDQEFIKQVPTGKGPDLVVLAHDRLGGLIANGVVGTVDLTDSAKDFAQVAVSGVTYEGQTYGVPYAIESLALVRNNKLTQEAPETWDQMITAGKASGAEYPVAIQVGENGDPYHLYPFETSFGSNAFKQDDAGSYTTELALGGPGGEAFANWLSTQGKEKILDPNVSGDIAKQAFLDGKAAYTVTGPWLVKDFQDADLDFSVLPLPKTGDNPAQPFVGVQAFFPSAKTTKKVAVNKFLTDFAASEAGQQILYESGKRTPALVSITDNIDDPILRGFAASAESGIPMPAIPEMNAVWKFWGNTEVDIMTEKQDPKAGWDTMIENINKEIN